MYSYNLNKNVPISYSIELTQRFQIYLKHHVFYQPCPEKGELVRLNILFL